MVILSHCPLTNCYYGNLNNHDSKDDDNNIVKKLLFLLSKTTAMRMHHALSTFLWNLLLNDNVTS